MLKEVTPQELPTNFGQETTLLVFHSTTCGACKMLKAVLEEFTEKHPKIEVYRIDIDKNREFANSKGVSTIPFTLVFKGGEVVSELEGYRGLPKLEEEVLKYA